MRPNSFKRLLGGSGELPNQVSKGNAWGHNLAYSVGAISKHIKDYLRWTPHPVIVRIRDNKNYIWVLLFSHYHYYRVGGPPKD